MCDLLTDARPPSVQDCDCPGIAPFRPLSTFLPLELPFRLPQAAFTAYVPPLDLSQLHEPTATPTPPCEPQPSAVAVRTVERNVPSRTHSVRGDTSPPLTATLAQSAGHPHSSSTGQLPATLLSSAGSSRGSRRRIDVKLSKADFARLFAGAFNPFVKQEEGGVSGKAHSVGGGSHTGGPSAVPSGAGTPKSSVTAASRDGEGDHEGGKEAFGHRGDEKIRDIQTRRWSHVYAPSR